MLSGLKWVTQLVHDTSELVVIVFIAWTAISFKNRVLHWLTHGVLAGRWAARGRGRGRGGEGSSSTGGSLSAACLGMRAWLCMRGQVLRPYPANPPLPPAHPA